MMLEQFIEKVFKTRQFDKDYKEFWSLTDKERQRQVREINHAKH